MNKTKKSGRLIDLPTLRIHPDKIHTFRLGLKRYRGFQGDVIAAALFAGGLRTFSHSIRHRRPRGLFSLDGGNANTRMTVDGIPDIMTETVQVRKGIKVRSQNTRFSLRRGPAGFLTDFLDAVTPAGSPLALFHRPLFLWPFFLKRIRSMAGTGRIHPRDRIRDGHPHPDIHAQVCVIGGGLAGMTAALTAADRQAEVVLLESRSWLGGDADHRETPVYNGSPLYQHSRELAERCEQHPNISIYLDTSAADWQPGGHVTAVWQSSEPVYGQQIRRIFAQSVVAAIGCRELPLLFEHNDRPGIMLTGCAHRLARTYGVLPGNQAVFSTAHDDGIRAALDLHDLGVNIRAVADVRREGFHPELSKQLKEKNIPFFKGWQAVKAIGKKHLEGVVIAPIDDASESQSFDCDLLAASAGLVPRSELLSAAGVSPVFDSATGFFMPQNLPVRLHAAGKMLGFPDADAIEFSGRTAGLQAAADCGKVTNEEVASFQNGAADFSPTLLAPALPLPASPGIRTYLCLDSDTTLKDLNQAVQKGFDRPDLFKRLTGTGFGQGGVNSHHLPLLMAKMQSLPAGRLMPPRSDPPVRPQLCAAWAGERPEPAKPAPATSPIEKQTVKHQMNDRPQSPRGTPPPQVLSELEAVHRNAGIMNAGGQGIFKLSGTDALEVLQRIYVSDFAGLRPNSALYSAMTDKYGCLADHGIIACTRENEYLITTTPERADTTPQWFRTHLPDHTRFSITDITGDLAVIRLAGPYAETILQSLTESNVSNAAFPLMAYRRLVLDKQIQVRVIRTSDLGVLTYDIYAPASGKASVWEMLLKAGKTVSILPFGYDAMNILHLENGFIHINRETEMRTALTDLQLGRLWDRRKSIPAVGHQALLTASDQKGRLKRVGFRLDETGPGGKNPLKDGAVIVEGTDISGHVCRCSYSPAIRAVIGTALVSDHLAEPGTRLKIYQHGMENHRRLSATVAELPFIQ